LHGEASDLNVQARGLQKRRLNEDIFLFQEAKYYNFISVADYYVLLLLLAEAWNFEMLHHSLPLQA
jgi:hypothetical protein